jgi:heptosyltransferase-1
LGSPKQAADDIHRLLIVKMSSIGDVVHALPFAQIVKERRPDIRIDWLVRSRCADLLTGDPYIDRTHIVPQSCGFNDLLALARSMRSRRYDAALDMQGLSFSGLLTRLSGAKRRIGLDLNRECNTLFLSEPTVPARADRERHAIDILRGFLPVLGLDANTPWPTLPYLADDTGAPPEIAALREAHEPIALNLGASTAEKRWPVDRWASLAEALIAEGRTVALVGGAQDVDAASGIVPTLGESPRLIDFAGKTTLRGTAAVIKECALLVTGDTGPMHIAVAVGTPVIGLFGPTRPLRTGPYGPQNRVIRHGEDGAPGSASMEQISVSEVLDAVQAMGKEKAACLSASSLRT